MQTFYDLVLSPKTPHRAHYSLHAWIFKTTWIFPDSTKMFYTFLLSTCCSHFLENSSLNFRTHCKYHLFCEVFPNSPSPSELLFHSLCSRNTLNTALMQNVYQVFNDYNLMACLHIFLPTPLGEQQGQECITCLP